MIGRKGSLVYRGLMMGFTTMIIMFGCFALFKHTLDGLYFVFLGLGGLIYFSYRLGKTFYGEDEDMKKIIHEIQKNGIDSQ